MKYALFILCISISFFSVKHSSAQQETDEIYHLSVRKYRVDLEYEYVQKKQKENKAAIAAMDNTEKHRNRIKHMQEYHAKKAKGEVDTLEYVDFKILFKMKQVGLLKNVQVNISDANKNLVSSTQYKIYNQDGVYYLKHKNEVHKVWGKAVAIEFRMTKEEGDKLKYVEVVGIQQSGVKTRTQVFDVY